MEDERCGEGGEDREGQIPGLLLLLLGKITSLCKDSSKSLVSQHSISLEAPSTAEHQLPDELLHALD